MAPQSQLYDLVHNHGVDLTWQQDFYQDLHAHPELSGAETETAKRILHRLSTIDGETISGIGGNGIVTILRNGEGSCALFRADFDALPVKEETGVPFASIQTQLNEKGERTPVMHACGHDMHTTALMGLLTILDQRRDIWSGTFIALFQPSEENGLGALRMVQDGLANHIPHPDVCFGQHIMPGRAGEIFSMPGAQFAACDSIRITIPGRSSHGSMPHQAIDPTFTAAMIITRLQAIVGREVNPNDFAVVSVGSLHAGSTSNIIPDSAVLELNCRFYEDNIREQVYSAIKRVVIAECHASGCEAEPSFEFYAHAEAVRNDETVFNTVRPVFDSVFQEQSKTAQRTTVSEDFPNIPQGLESPYLYWTVGCTPSVLWDKALASGRIAQDVPVNHQSTFIPDYEPTVYATTHAGLSAILSYLG